MGVTKDQLDHLDLSDNELPTLTNFPILRRLSSLSASNNPLRSISTSLPIALPNLTTLTLANTQFPLDYLPTLANLLAKSRKLTSLVLVQSPVQKHKYYRSYLVFKCSHLRFLDFTRITQQDRHTSLSLFSDKSNPQDGLTPLGRELASGTLDDGGAGGGGGKGGIDFSGILAGEE